jgi:hypothetical protein
MKKIIFATILTLSQICFSQTIEETVDFINDKLKIHSSLYYGHYEIEISNSGILKIHTYDINDSARDPSKSKKHFIAIFELKSMDIKVTEQELFIIRFECPDKRNCVKETYVHLNKVIRQDNCRLFIADKVNLYKLERAFLHLQKIFKNKTEPF